jgi:formate dehydrogenase maturation protein FdhE
MKCWHCNNQLIWGADHAIDEESEEYDMVTNLSCPSCESFVEVYHKK